jgi:hypothetical protein
MIQKLSRLAWAVVLALIIVTAASPVSAQSQFPEALSSTEFEAILPRIALPDAQRAAAMVEYDRYQRATSELRVGSIERYLKDPPEGGMVFGMGNDERPADEVRNQVRAYRSLLAQWDTLENALIDSLLALGADATRLDRARRSLELRRIEQSTSDALMMRSRSQADLWAIVERSSKDLDPSQLKQIDDRLGAREAEYVEAVRAIRSAALEQPERLIELKAKAMADHPAPSSEVMQQQMEQAQEQGGEVDLAEVNKILEAHFRAMAGAYQQSREPVQAARTRATRLGASILSEAFQGIPQPRGASAWLAFIRASGVGAIGAIGIDDGGAIRLVESMAAQGPLTPEQDQAVTAAFATWQASVLGSLNEQVPIAFLGDDSENIQEVFSKRAEAAKARATALKTEVRAALGLPPDPEPIAQDAPDGEAAADDGGDPVGVTVRVGVATAASDAAEDAVAVGGDAVVLDMAGDGLEGLMAGEDGGPMFLQVAGSPRVQPITKQELQELLELCGSSESIKPVVAQLHADYLEVASSVKNQLDAAPSAQTSFGPNGATVPSKEDIAAKYEALRKAVGAMERADADFFADLAAVLDDGCVRQQAQFRARSLARAGAGGAGSSMASGMASGNRAGPFVDPESVIRAAVTVGAIDVASAATLREHVSTQGHEPMLAALKNQFEVTMSKGREFSLSEADCFKQALDGAEVFDAASSMRMREAEIAMVNARSDAASRARQVLEALPALLKEPQRPGFLRAADVVRYPETFKDPTDMEPMFAKALALEGLDSAATSAITTQRAEYRSAYAKLRDQLAEFRPRTAMPDFSDADAGGIEDFKARMNASQAAQRQCKQLKTDRDELNRRTMRQLQSTLGEERAKAIGELPAQRKGRGISIPELEGMQITVP